jgi:hypothetical protein
VLAPDGTGKAILGAVVVSSICIRFASVAAIQPRFLGQAATHLYCGPSTWSSEAVAGCAKYLPASQRARGHGAGDALGLKVRLHGCKACIVCRCQGQPGWSLVFTAHGPVAGDERPLPARWMKRRTKTQ